jgi:hypothetical protein
VDLFNQIRKKLVIFVHLDITICVVLDHNTVLFQKEKGGYIYKSLVCKTPIVIKVDRNKNVTLNICPQGE